MSVFAMKGTQRPRVLADEISFQCAVNKILLETTRPSNASRNGMLTVSEMKELEQAYLTGDSPEEFAQRLQERDLRALATTVDRTGESYPMIFDKPLSREDTLMLDFLVERYTADDSTPLVKVEDEQTITLRVPEVVRRRSLAPISVEGA